MSRPASRPASRPSRRPLLVVLTVAVLGALTAAGIVAATESGSRSTAGAAGRTTSAGSTTSTSRPPPATITTTTLPTPATTTRAYTATGDRAGFATGYEFVVHPDAVAVAEDIDAAAATGARWIRFDMEWSVVQSRSRDEFDWGTVDPLVERARDRGLSVIGLLGYSPDWAATPGCHELHCEPADPADYAAYARAAVARYAPLGVHTWELWNEPNVSQFWQPSPDPDAYTALLHATYPAIKALDPGATVLTGGTAPARDGNGSYAPASFLLALYYGGARGSFDAVGHHPYAFPARPTDEVPRNAFLETQALADVMAANGDGAKKVWGTEVGAPTVGRGVSEDEQPDWVREYYATWNGWPFTGPLLWYTLRDTRPDPGSDTSYGLLHFDRSSKPAFDAFLAVMQGR